MRRESALHPLDGLRAIAVTWVIINHMSVAWHQFFLCLPQANTDAPYKFLVTGELGVEIFFCISGFLIAYILLKECSENDGKINYLHFYKFRFLRIWPALALRSITEFFINHKSRDEVLTPLAFVSNIFGFEDITWTVSVEFQFYLISPFIVLWMHK